LVALLVFGIACGDSGESDLRLEIAALREEAAELRLQVKGLENRTPRITAFNNLKQTVQNHTGQVQDIKDNIVGVEATIDLNQQAILDNLSAIELNQAQVTTNMSGIAANVDGITNNATGIAENVNTAQANAADIVANYTGIATNATALTANQILIASNQTLISDNTTFIATNMADIETNGYATADVATDLDTLETLTLGVDKLLAVTEVSGTDLVFSGVNMHLQSGSGSSDDNGTLLGLGNLVIGYNETSTGSAITRAGSHNLVLGTGHEYTSWGGIVAGQSNNISAPNASIISGTSNTVSGQYGAIVSGSSSTVSGTYAVIVSGRDNKASGRTA
jgi:hypothetical protein